MMVYLRILLNLRSVRVYLNRHLDWIEAERKEDQAQGCVWFCYDRWAHHLGRILGRNVIDDL